MIEVAILALNDCMQSSVTGTFDILSVASNQWKSMGNGALFDLKIVTDDGLPVTSFNNMKITPHCGAKEVNKPDIIFIPVIFGDLAPILSNKKTVEWLREKHKGSAVICAVCAGVFLAARTGLLKSRKVTTHWNLADDFIQLFPDVILKKEKMLIDEGDFVTAGGVTAYMDLALYLTAKYGSMELSGIISRLLLIDPIRKTQSPYITFSINTDHSDENILKVQKYLGENYSKSITISELADIAGLTERTFTRRFKALTGDTPLEYQRNLRVGKARMLLETTSDSIESITFEAGYEDVSSFRRLFKKITGLSPTAYRRKFSVLIL